ncbi:hypothetical protein V8C86DRAFT_3181071 [Haematococcus lacustris]
MGGHTLLCHNRLLLLLLGLGWLVAQPFVAQARVLLAFGWQSCLIWPPAQLQWAQPALPNALQVQRCIAVPVQPPTWLWCWLGFGSLALGLAFALRGLGGLSRLFSLGDLLHLAGWTHQTEVHLPGFQFSGLVGCSWSSCSSQGRWSLSTELTRLVVRVTVMCFGLASRKALTEGSADSMQLPSVCWWCGRLSRHRVGCQPDIPFVHNQLTTLGRWVHSDVAHRAKETRLADVICSRAHVAVREQRLQWLALMVR